MKPKKYSTHYAKLSNLILSMPEKQQAKLLDLAHKIQKGENLFAKKDALGIEIDELLKSRFGKISDEYMKKVFSLSKDEDTKGLIHEEWDSFTNKLNEEIDRSVDIDV